MSNCGMGCDSCLPMAENQPFGIEIFTADGVFIKQMVIQDAGTLVPQHSHKYDHMSMLAAGSFRVWKDGVLDRDYIAPIGIKIRAGVKHAFLSLEPMTIIYCVHNLHEKRNVQIVEEHRIQFIGEP